jgi:hypothetical protein
MLCKNTFCGAKVRPFYEVTKDFNENFPLSFTRHTQIRDRAIIMTRSLYLSIIYKVSLSYIDITGWDSPLSNPQLQG